MTEATQVNHVIRRDLGPYGRFLRVEHSIETDWPDWFYRCRGTAGWIEAKIIHKSGRCPRHFTRGQLMWGEEEARTGGSWYLLGLREPRTWLLYNAAGAREWFDGIANRPLLELPGRFPTREIIEIIAPRPRPPAFD